MATHGWMAAAAALAALAAPTLAHAGDSWYLLLISKDYSDAMYVDVTSLTTTGTVKSAVLQTVERVSVEPGDIFSTSIVLETDCATRAQKMVKATVFNDQEKGADRAVPAAEAAPPNPGTRGELVERFVCSPPESWDRSKLVDEGSVGGSLRQYGRFMLQTMLVDAVNKASSTPK